MAEMAMAQEIVIFLAQIASLASRTNASPTPTRTAPKTCLCLAWLGQNLLAQHVQ